MKLSESKTFRNLARAYAGETQASTRYKFIEYGARNQGLNALAEVIDKIAYNEFNHGRMFYTHIQSASKETIDNVDISAGFPFREKWDLADNLRLAAEDEEHDRNLYKEFEKTAREEGFEDIANLFNMTASVEECHRKLFLDLYEQMRDGTIYKKPKTTKWKCSGCGYEAESKEAWDECPLCRAKQGFVMLKVASD